VTTDQKFLKSSGIRPDDPVKEQWMTWRDEEITQVRAKLAEVTRQLHAADERDIRRGNEVNMWRLAAFAGWFGLALFAMQGKW